MPLCHRWLDGLASKGGSAMHPVRGPRPTRAMLVSALASILALARRALAQGTTVPPAIPVPTPSDGSAATQAGVVIGLVVAGIVLVVAMAKIFDLRRKREAEAVAIQGRIADVLLSEASLARLPVAVTVHVPLLRGGPAEAEVRGEVPTQEARQAVMRLVEREMAGLRATYQLADRLMVLPTTAVHAA